MYITRNIIAQINNPELPNSFAAMMITHQVNNAINNTLKTRLGNSHTILAKAVRFCDTDNFPHVQTTQHKNCFLFVLLIDSFELMRLWWRRKCDYHFAHCLTHKLGDRRLLLRLLPLALCRVQSCSQIRYHLFLSITRFSRLQLINAFLQTLQSVISTCCRLIPAPGFLGQNGWIFTPTLIALTYNVMCQTQPKRAIYFLRNLLIGDIFLCASTEVIFESFRYSGHTFS